MLTTNIARLSEKVCAASLASPLAQAYRADIEGLRAVAIIAVVLYHFGLGLPGGYVGVDIFFVISGYLITQALLARPLCGLADLYRFLLRRVRRLLPALLAVTGVTLLLSVFVLIPTELQSLGESAWHALAFISNYLFLSQAGYFDAPSLSKPLLHTWSLAVEGQFYLVFALLLGILLRRMPGGARGVASVLVVMMVVSLGTALVQVRTSPEMAFYTLPARLWELIAGALLALGVIPAVRHETLRMVLQGGGLTMIMWAILMFDHNTRFPGDSALLPVLGAALLIHSRGTVGAPFVSALLETAPMRWIGKISYSLYLWHWPLLVLTTFAMGRLGGPQIFLLSTVVLAISALSYRYVEQPYNNWLVPSRRKAVLLIVLLAVLAATLAASAWLVRSKGWPARLSLEGQQYAAAAGDVAPQAETCHTISPERVTKDSLCPLGPDTPTSASTNPAFIVWGDSHAHALYGAFDALARAYGVNGKHGSRAACPPLLGIRVVTHTNDDCVRFNEAMVAYINRHDVKRIFLVARWPVYIGGHTPGGIESGPEPLLQAMDAAAEPAMSGAFSHALGKTLDAIRRPGRTIYVVTGVPEATHHIPFSLARSTLLLGPASQVLQPRRTDVEARLQIVLQALAHVAMLPDVRGVSVHELLCDKASCQITAQGRSLYRDADHLSAFGAGVIQPVFEPMFRGMEGSGK